MLATEQSKEKLTLGLNGIEESIKMATGRHGVHFGETINLYGPSGGGKSWVLSLLLEHALQLDSNDNVIYLDLDGRFVSRRNKKRMNIDNTLSEQPNQEQNNNERFHLFQPNRGQLLATIQGLDSWFYRHTNKRVTMVLVDGIAALNGNLMETLRRLQRKWSFVLVITSLEPQSNTLCHYRFHVYKKLNQVEMKLTS
ncbi:hypothetical protein BDA99DRAFT_516696 [Phascolomyces articulosus]|uniref:ORC1/DEAH AAA+ ATPase domain-containing protein n=1 Tax=Phascolomyces articulosus TaxID=60185 RepID=A0AAD5PBI4_9FUNG|nr:hypothetical protein BDA99DRAFT_516696 [Phascolomyces articulosus]